MKLCGFIVLLLAAGNAGAAPESSAALFGAGDPERGRVMVQKDCDGCHTRSFGDAAAIYTRPDHRVRTPAQLQAQITYCNTQLGTKYFPDDEVHIAAYLNHTYYHFKP